MIASRATATPCGHVEHRSEKRHRGRQADRDLARRTGRDARGPDGRGGDRTAGQPRRTVEERQSLQYDPATKHGGRHTDFTARRLGRDSSGTAETAGSRSGRSRSVRRDNVPPGFVISVTSFASKRRSGDSAWRCRGKGSHGCCYRWAQVPAKAAAEREATAFGPSRSIFPTSSPWRAAAGSAAGLADDRAARSAHSGCSSRPRVGRARWLLAKRLNARTELGAYLDPLADKALLIAMYLALAMARPAAGLVVGPGVGPRPADRRRRRRDPLPPSGFKPRPMMIGKINTLAADLLVAFVIAHVGGLVDLGPAVACVDRRG